MEEQHDYITEAMQLLKGDRQDAEFYSSGFTPAPDVLIKKYGIVCATVWGKVWRYCQMDEDVCRAAQERLARELGITPNTLNKYLTILEKNGYIKDRTPELRNKPHIYTDTGKLRLKITLSMSDSTTQNLRSDYSKFAVEESTTNSRNPYRVYEANIGAITPILADKIDDFVNTYSLNWFLECVGLAVRYNKRNLAYMESIARRWTEQGKDDGTGGKPKQSKQDEYNDALRKAGYLV